VLAPLGAAGVALVAGPGPQRSDALLDAGEAGTLRALSWAAGGLHLLRLQSLAPPLATRIGEARPDRPVDAGYGELLRMAWASPFPALLHDASQRIVDANDAFAAFSGLPRRRCSGATWSSWCRRGPGPVRRRAAGAGRCTAQRQRGHADGAPLAACRWPNAGSARRCTRCRRPADALLLEVLQDSTGEHVARAQAERSLNELAQWFDLSPVGMLVFDHAGLIVRSNPAFEAAGRARAGDAVRRRRRTAAAAGLA
jgi:PAS domain-containing protein